MGLEVDEVVDLEGGRMGMRDEASLVRGIRSFPAFPVTLISVGENVFTASLVHVFSFSPPLIGVGVHKSRYSFELLKRQKDFVVNLPSLDLLEAVKVCGEKSGRDVDKFKLAKLTPKPSQVIGSVQVAECLLSLECQVVEELVLSERTWFIGEVKAVRFAANFDKTKLLNYWGGEYRRCGSKVADRY